MTARSEKIEINRRRLVSAAAATAAAAVAVLGSSISPGHAQARSEQAQIAVLDFVEVDNDITLRRMVVHNPKPKGTVLFLHGFPETLYAWKDISLTLADDYEVHAFDWPGYVCHRGRRSTGSPTRPRITRVF
jgi:pimeloyl-ACP methyl ester carboxylesterase